MPIIKPITAPNGAAVTFHKAVRVNFEPGDSTVSVNVASWTDEDAHDAGGGVRGLVWMWPMDMPMASLNGLDASLALTVPFDGGTVVTDQSQSLDAVQLRQCALLDAAYNAVIARDVTFTTGAGDTHSYQCDRDSVDKLSYCLVGWRGSLSVPSGFYWLSTDNSRISFTYADLQALAAAFVTAGHAAFVTLQDLKAAVRAATTTDAVRAIVWPSPG